MPLHNLQYMPVFLNVELFPRKSAPSLEPFPTIKFLLTSTTAHELREKDTFIQTEKKKRAKLSPRMKPVDWLAPWRSK